MSDMNEANAILIAAVIGALGAIAAVCIGWFGGLFSRSFEERFSGAKLVIDCPPEGSKDITENAVYMKIRLPNDRLKAHPVVPGSSTYRGRRRNETGCVSSFRVP